MKLISWNVNGIRAVLKRDLLGYMEASKADIICFQETKAHPGDVQHIEWPAGYQPIWNSAAKKGYSGTALFSKKAPLQVKIGIGLPDHDNEGRVIAAEFPDMWVVTVYTPNSKRELERLDYRTREWEPAFLAFLKSLEKSGKPVAVCGDLNVAHNDIDLANPKTNRRNAGFTDEERACFNTLLGAGYVDTFREFEKGGGHYTWWSNFSSSRERNIGWRIDYWLVSETLRPRLKKAWIEPHVMGSDHCPVGLELA